MTLNEDLNEEDKNRKTNGNLLSQDTEKYKQGENKEIFIEFQKIGDKKTESKELPENTLFCGIPIKKLTKDQKILHKKYKDDIDAMEKLNKIVHNKTKGQFEFHRKAKRAFSDKNIAQNTTKQGADIAVKKLGDGWLLPNDVDYGLFPDKKNKLNPEESQIDKMINDMPGETPEVQAENFRLLTGVYGGYWTGQNHNKRGTDFQVRDFRKDHMYKLRFNGSNQYYSVRAVRDLAA